MKYGHWSPDSNPDGTLKHCAVITNTFLTGKAISNNTKFEIGNSNNVAFASSSPLVGVTSGINGESTLS